MLNSDSVTKDGTLNRGDAYSRKGSIYLENNMQCEDAWPNESLIEYAAEETIEMWTT